MMSAFSNINIILFSVYIRDKNVMYVTFIDLKLYIKWWIKVGFIDQIFQQSLTLQAATRTLPKDTKKTSQFLSKKYHP